jgi:hypothetical protein
MLNEPHGIFIFHNPQEARDNEMREITVSHRRDVQQDGYFHDFVGTALKC